MAERPEHDWESDDMPDDTKVETAFAAIGITGACLFLLWALLAH
jgi:hypothetical protein